jgi:hypothetical protein
MVIVQALVTALLAGLFSGLVVFALNERRDREKLLLEKAEQAVEAYADWADTLSNWPLAHFDMFRGEREEGREKTSEVWELSRTQFRRARMLIGIYLPEKRHVLGDLYAACNDMITLRPELSKASIANEEMPDHAKEKLTEYGKNIVRVGQASVELLIGAAHSRAHSPFLIRKPTLWRRQRVEAA